MFRDDAHGRAQGFEHFLVGFFADLANLMDKFKKQRPEKKALLNALQTLNVVCSKRFRAQGKALDAFLEGCVNKTLLWRIRRNFEHF